MQLRYKENLADYITIEQAALLVQERAGISGEEAKEDIILALQDYKLRGRIRNANAERPKHLYSDDMTYSRVVGGLAVGRVRWEHSVVIYQHERDIPSFYEFDVSRREFDALWPALDIDAKPPIERSETEQAIEPPKQTPPSPFSADVAKKYSTRVADHRNQNDGQRPTVEEDEEWRIAEDISRPRMRALRAETKLPGEEKGGAPKKRKK